MITKDLAGQALVLASKLEPVTIDIYLPDNPVVAAAFGLLIVLLLAQIVRWLVGFSPF